MKRMRPGDSLRILVIEDDPDTRSNLQDILELDEHRVESAGSAAEALARADWSSVAAIVLDRKLPDATADELLPRLKRLAPDAAVLVVTGYADIQGAISALRLGATDYILKPIEADDLRARLRRIVDGQRTGRELKAAQERAMRAERLAAIGQMVAGLAHESRNALQRSQACLEMLALQVEDRAEALGLIARIQDAQDHLHHLYEDVRSYAAPIRLERRGCDLAVIWREAWMHVEPQRRGRDAALREADGGLDLTCEVDPFRLGQVFRNVMENALAACADPVVVEIACSPAQIDGLAALRVAVRDNGPGLGQQERERIFEPFYTTKTKGTGLGMAISRRIVEAHGGRIAVGDATSSGAEIVITLPRGEP